LLPFQQCQTTVEAKVPHLAFTIGTVEVNMEEYFVPFQDIATEAAPSLPSANQSGLLLPGILAFLLDCEVAKGYRTASRDARSLC
jgi:hypothetical protein